MRLVPVPCCSAAPASVACPVVGCALAALLWITGCASQLPAARATRSGDSHGPLLALTGPVRTIVLDAGHGGHDPGAVYFGLREKSLALDIARRVRDGLRAVGLTVIMTRETDTFVPLNGRSDLANRTNADLFVSIHLNANLDRSVSGAEVYYPRESVVSGATRWPPQVRAEEIGVPSLVVRQVLWDLVLQHSRLEGVRIARALCGELERQLAVGCTVKPARFVVLREAWMPSVLVEVGYISHRAESQRLESDAYRQAAAEAIVRGLLAYMQQLGAQHI